MTTKQAQRTEWNGQYTIMAGYIVTAEGLNSRIVAAIDPSAGVEPAQELLRRQSAHVARIAELEKHIANCCDVIDNYLNASTPWEDHPVMRSHYRVAKAARAALAKVAP